jgi:hypothetical protein
VTPVAPAEPAAPLREPKARPQPQTPIAKGVDAAHSPVPKLVTRLPAAVNTRCAALTERLALGETLSGDAQAFFNRECRK